MPRIKAEVIEDFEKILDKSGMLKQAYHSLEEYKDDAEARLGSDTLENIEILYGVKPDTQEYKINIVEQAHPNSVIIAPSYDKMQGLVENVNERNKIMSNIALNTPTGNHTNHRYAHQELIMELVRLANEMDVRNQDELRVLADDCLIELSNKLPVKKAIGPILIGALAIATVLGAGWLLSHVDDTEEGPVGDCDRAIAKLNDLKTNSWYESDVDTIVQQEVDNIILHIQKLKLSIQNFLKVENIVNKARTLSEMNQLDKLKDISIEHGETVQQAVDKFKAEVLEIDPLLKQAIDNFSSEVYQKEHSKPSVVSEITGWFGEMIHGRWGLVANDFISAVNALKPLKSSIEDMVKRINSLDMVVSKYKDDVQQSMVTMGDKSSETVSTPTDKEDGQGFLDNIGKYFK